MEHGFLERVHTHRLQTALRPLQEQYGFIIIIITSDLQPSTAIANHLPGQLVSTQIRTIGVKLLLFSKCCATLLAKTLHGEDLQQSVTIYN